MAADEFDLAALEKGREGLAVVAIERAVADEATGDIDGRAIRGRVLRDHRSGGAGRGALQKDGGASDGHEFAGDESLLEARGRGAGRALNPDQVVVEGVEGGRVGEGLGVECDRLSGGRQPVGKGVARLEGEEGAQGDGGERQSHARAAALGAFWPGEVLVQRKGGFIGIDSFRRRIGVGAGVGIGWAWAFGGGGVRQGLFGRFFGRGDRAVCRRVGLGLGRRFSRVMGGLWRSPGSIPIFRLGLCLACVCHGRPPRRRANLRGGVSNPQPRVPILSDRAIRAPQGGPGCPAIH